MKMPNGKPARPSIRHVVFSLPILATFTIAFGVLGLHHHRSSRAVPSQTAPGPGASADAEYAGSIDPAFSSLDEATALGYLEFPERTGEKYHVAPGGSDNNDGKSSAAPLATIQAALDKAMPGDEVHLADGVYMQDTVTKRSGEAGKPILIRGGSGAVVKGGGKARIFEINHSYITLRGFTIDGQHGAGTSPSHFRDKLVFVQGKEVRSGPTGVKIEKMTLRNAGGECLRLRYFVTRSEVAHNIITNCGVYDFRFSGGGKNGEGVYIGTSNNQWADGKNPTADPDASHYNVIHNNNFNTQGNECVDIKEGASFNIVENNDCTGQKDPNSAGLDSRGDANTFRSNTSYLNAGAGVRLGGATVNGVQHGKNNIVTDNRLTGNQSGGIKFMVAPQASVCGNTLAGNALGESVGSFGKQFAPAQAC